VRRIHGIVLAGGKSRRYGEPKAFAERNGIPFYEYSIRALSPCSNRIILVASTELKPLFHVGPDIKLMEDLPSVKGQGPLAGILTGMQAGEAEWYIVLPIDVPFVEKNVIKSLIDDLDDNYEAVIPFVKEKKQPLFGLYKYSVRKKIEEHLTMGHRSVQQLLDKLRVKYVEFPDNTPFQNINYQKDFPSDF
jgi:molybdenum cofactor guanylyltransferase